MTQFLVQTKQESPGWKVQIDNLTLGSMVSIRQLARSTAQFPLPPQTEIDAIQDGEEVRAFCRPENDSQRENVLSGLLSHENQANAVRLFGRYLFETLISLDSWKQMVSQSAGGSIEVILALQPDDWALNRLPWETMHLGSGDAGLDAMYKDRFLAACSRVAIYRRVEGAQGKIDSIQTPPRVLFVIGSELNNDVIRPGAEYLGLLRSLSKDGQAIHSRILFRANLDTLHEAVKDYLPHVVHFICHGEAVPGQKPYLIMFPSDSAKPETARVTAAKLAQILKEMPSAPILVVNACSTAAEDELAVSRPFTTELVELGLPVVLGMAGRITDQACRMFTQGFYLALLRDGELAWAASLGRRAAIVKGGLDAANQIDWALPVLFVSEEMANAKVRLVPSQSLLFNQRAAQEYTPDRTQPFCDRLDMLQQYEFLMRPTTNDQGGERLNFPDMNRPVQVLAVHNVRQESGTGELKRRFGRTWLLEEMAAQAARDGHVPVLVSLKDSINGANAYPHTLKEYLLDLLYVSLTRTYEILRGQGGLVNLNWTGLDYMDTLFSLNKGENPPETFPDGKPFPKGPPFRKDNPTDPAMIGKILSMELKRFLEEVRAQHPVQEQDGIRLLLLLDDLHRMAEFGSDLLKAISSSDIRIMVNDLRIVVAYEILPSSGDNKPVLSSTLENYANHFWVYPAQLRAFHSPFAETWQEDEWIKAKLVYKQYMMQWIEDGSRKGRAFIFALPEQDMNVQLFIRQLALKIQGIPSWLRIGDEWIQYELARKSLRVANDDEILAQAGE